MIDTILSFFSTLPPYSKWTVAILCLFLAALVGYEIVRSRKLKNVAPPGQPVAHPHAPEATPPSESTAPLGPCVSDAPGGLFQRLRSGLGKTRHAFIRDIESLFTKGKSGDAALLDPLEEMLITADIGVKATMELIGSLSRDKAILTNPEALKGALKQEIVKRLEQNSVKPLTAAVKPHVTMIVGVNGVGKTTTIGKLAARYTAQNKKVLIAAADTFRAAAVEQLAVWSERAGAELVRHREGADPAAVAFDGVEAGISRGVDHIFIDTAGRLHTKVNLMEELKKVKRTIQKRLPEAPHEILLVLDATTGQNALAQAKQFHEAIGVTGIALTKLDGTAKGGIAISICSQINVPLRYIGVGEQIEDLQEFDPETFADALFS